MAVSFGSRFKLMETLLMISYFNRDLLMIVIIMMKFSLNFNKIGESNHSFQVHDSSLSTPTSI